MNSPELTIIVSTFLITSGLVSAHLAMSIIKEGGPQVNPVLQWLQRKSPEFWQYNKVALHAALAVLVFTQAWAIYLGVLFLAASVGGILWDLHTLKKMSIN